MTNMVFSSGTGTRFGAESTMASMVSSTPTGTRVGDEFKVHFLLYTVNKGTPPVQRQWG